MGCCYKNLNAFDSSECSSAKRLFALHHVLERRARAERRIIGRRNLQRRTRGHHVPRARRGRPLGKRADWSGHLVARAVVAAILSECASGHASDEKDVHECRRHGIDESVLVQSRRRGALRSNRAAAFIVARGQRAVRHGQSLRAPHHRSRPRFPVAPPPPPHPPIVLPITRDHPHRLYPAVEPSPPSSPARPSSSSSFRAFERRQPLDRSTSSTSASALDPRSDRRRASSSRARWPTYLSLGSFVRSFVRSRARWRVTRGLGARAVGSW